VVLSQPTGSEKGANIVMESIALKTTLAQDQSVKLRGCYANHFRAGVEAMARVGSIEIEYESNLARMLRRMHERWT
jgi:hypothetical protein